MLRDNGSDFLRSIVALSCSSRGDPAKLLFTLFMQQASISFDFALVNDFPIFQWVAQIGGNHLIIQLSVLLTFSSGDREDKLTTAIRSFFSRFVSLRETKMVDNLEPSNW